MTQLIGDAIAEQVRHYRKRRNWSVRQLAEECIRLGGTQLTTGSLGNIERGQAEDAKRGRRNVTAEELLVLARALRVPPILLMFPIGTGVQVEVVPGNATSAWSAARWFTGEAEFPSQLSAEEWAAQYGRGERDPASGLHEWYENPESGWEVGAAAVLLYRRHQQLVREHYAVPKTVGNLTNPPLIPELANLSEGTWQKLLARLWASAEDKIREVRAEMRRAGLTLPELPNTLASLNQQEKGRRDGR